MSAIDMKKKNDSESRALGNFMLTLYNTRIKNKIDVLEGESFTELKKELNPIIESIFKKYMIRAYIRGGQFTLDKLKIKNVPFFNIDYEGLQAIDNKFRTFIDRFWSQMQKIEMRNQQVNPKSAALTDIRIDQSGDVTEPRNTLTWRTYMFSRPLLMLISAYNLGVVLSPKQAVTVLEKSGNTHREEITRLQSVKFRFVTKKDSLVCEICRPLDDQIFEANDPQLANLPKLHYHCRCILEIIT